MSRTETVRAHVQLVRDLSNELAGHLYTLPEDVWRVPERYASACDQWKIADVVTHLILGAITYSLSISRAVDGLTSPPIGHRPRSRQEGVERTVALRVAYDEDVFPEFNASCMRLNSLLVSLKPEDYEARAWHPIGVVPVSRLIEYRVLELAVHSWDVRSPLDGSARLSQRALPFLTEWIEKWFRAGFQKGSHLEAPVRYRFLLSGPASEAYDVVVSGVDFRLQPADNGRVDVTFRCDADTYVLFGMGRLPFPRAVRRGRLSFEGDEKLASRFTDWFRPL